MNHFIYVPSTAGVLLHAIVTKFFQNKKAKVLSFVKKETSKL